MDLETENRIAAILLKEAAELQRQAENEGVLAYLRQPQARGRPNSRFLSATVRGIQQANRAVEVNEMWRLRQKELELNDRLKGRSRAESSRGGEHGYNQSAKSTSERRDSNDLDNKASCSRSKRRHEDGDSREDEGLRDEEIEEFLHSRVKRGRGSVGSRMDETGPYLPRSMNSSNHLGEDTWRHVALGPENSAYSRKLRESSKDSRKSRESSEDSRDGERRKKKSKRSKRHSKKHKSKDKSKDKRKKKRKEEKSV